MTMGGGMNGINTTASSTATAASNASHASDQDSMKDLISLDDSHNNSFDLEDFDPLNQNARPMPGGGGVTNSRNLNTQKKSTTLPTNVRKPSSASIAAASTLMTTSSISNPMYTYYTPQHLPAQTHQQLKNPVALKPPSEKPPPLPKSIPPPMPPPDEDFELLRKYGLDQFTLITTTVTSTSNSSTITTTGMNNWTTFD